MHILTSLQLKEADAQTMAVQQISSWQLMERAAGALFESLKADVDIYSSRFAILCGAGNNGGDGLALARMIHSAGGEVSVFLLEAPFYSADNRANREKLGDLPVTLFNLQSRLHFPEKCILIDALFGYGLNRLLSPDWNGIIAQVNAAGPRILAIDMPSGLLSDAHTPPDAPVVRATKVYTFHSPKKALLLPENAGRAEEFTVIPIRLEDSGQGNEYYLTAEMCRSWITTPSRFSHKGTFGHVLITGGSYGKIGAVILAARAALKTGCGLATAFVPRCGYIPFQTALPEAMVMTALEEDFLDIFPDEPRRFSAIGIGVGMGTSEKTEAAFLRFLKSGNLPPLVLDADALNILSRNPDYLSDLPENTILTPHPKELERLVGSWKNDFEKLETVRKFCAKRRVILVIKGANSAILFPDGRIAFNSTGNYGMAKGGSGDVLTGMITSLLAQGYTPEQSATIGVFLHGKAGDLARERQGARGMIPTDTIEAIPHAWISLSPPYL